MVSKRQIRIVIGRIKTLSGFAYLSDTDAKGYLILKITVYGLAAFILVLSLSACSTSLYKAGINVERWRAKVKEKSLYINDLQISYLDGGSGDVILLIHGFGANKDSWNRFARHLTDKFRVVAVDLPGHGDSTSNLEHKYDVQSRWRSFNHCEW